MSRNPNPKKRMHFCPQYFHNPVHRIRVVLVGAGGNGSQMLSALARIDHALVSLGKPGIHVTVWDPDTVEAPNIGRQLFTASEIGRNKAECIVTRFNRALGLDWDAVPKRWEPGKGNLGNIIISCVDKIDARLQIARSFHENKIRSTKGRDGKTYRPEGNEYSCFYWLDLGNAQSTGQAVLGSGTIKQPRRTGYATVETLPSLDEVADLSSVMDEDSGPSCSLAEALEKQDLFINSVLVQTAAALLWSLLKDVAIDIHGVYVNLDTYRTVPLAV